MSSRKWITGISMVVWAASMGACSAAPGADPGATESEPLVKCGPAGCGSLNPPRQPPVCDAPRLWPFDYTGDESMFECAQERAIPGDWHAFDTSSAFEQSLQGLGCSYRLAAPSAIGDVRTSLIEDGEPFAVTACQASCVLNNLIQSSVGVINPDDGTMVDSYIVERKPEGCDVALPTGIVYVEWDPHCGGGCPTYAVSNHP